MAGASWEPLLLQTTSEGINSTSCAVASSSTRILDLYTDYPRLRRLFPINLATLTATDKDIKQHPARTDRGTLKQECEFSSVLFPQALPSGICTGGYVPGQVYRLPLYIPQQVLSTAVTSLYSRSILLGPDNVEHVLMLAQYLGIICLEDACHRYLLGDDYLGHALAAEQSAVEPSGIIIQLAKLASCYCPSLLTKGLLSLLAEGLWWGSATLAAVLEASVDLAGAEQLLALKLKMCAAQYGTERGYVCGSQVGRPG